MNINDLAILLAAVDIAVKRGAFSILEIGQIGEMAAKLNAFIADATAQANAAKAEAEAEGGEEAQAEGSEEAQAEQPAA
jgi:hypothetical protein